MIFDGYPYLSTRVVPAMYHIVLRRGFFPPHDGIYCTSRPVSTSSMRSASDATAIRYV